jgi:hypothetical protein
MPRIYNDDGSYYTVPMITTTVQELLDIQARQLDWYCGVSPDSKGTITPPHPAIAAELRRRIKEATGSYIRPDMEIEAAYAQIPRGGDIEYQLTMIRVAFAAIDPIAMFDMTDEELSQALRPTVFFKDKNIPVHIMAHKKMKPFMSAQQWELVKELMKGEEGEFFRHKMIELAGVIDDMPRTYKGRGEDSLAHLHYFSRGSGNWYITELDKGDPKDTPADFMSQCYGWADPFGDPSCAEWGYIGIPELVGCNVELDFHFTPKPVAQILKCDLEDGEAVQKMIKEGGDL